MTRLNDASRQATAELIARFAATGRDDPTIAARLGIPVSQVRTLRKEFDIPAGETRWVNPIRPATPAPASPAPVVPAGTPASTETIASRDSVRE